MPRAPFRAPPPAGTVAAVECCYGAELYDPQQANRSRGFCHTYLGAGAYGYFGSSTISYGESDRMQYADVLCRYFLKSVVDGASLGGAALEARLQFAQDAGTLDPVELKSLAQFNLMGDPSIHPVATAAPSARAAGPAGHGPSRRRRAVPPGRSLRRLQLAERGRAVENTVAVPRRMAGAAPGRLVKRELTGLARRAQLGATKVLSYRIEGGALPPAAVARAGGRGEFHLMTGRRRRAPAPLRPRTVVVVREQGGELTLVAHASRR